MKFDYFYHLEYSEYCGLNRGFNSKFYVGSWVRHETPEERQRIYRPKRHEYNNVDEDNSSNILIKTVILSITPYIKHKDVKNENEK